MKRQVIPWQPELNDAVEEIGHLYSVSSVPDAETKRMASKPYRMSYNWKGVFFRPSKELIMVMELNERPGVGSSRGVRSYTGIARAIILISAIVSVSKGQQSSPNSQADSSTRTAIDREIRVPIKADHDNAAEVRLREGTKLTNQRGRFAKTGDRVTFYPNESNENFRNLENLALERVVRVMGDSNDASKIEWSVDGTVTEYQGENYLMITRAVVTTNSDSPEAH